MDELFKRYIVIFLQIIMANFDFYLLNVTRVFSPPFFGVGFEWFIVLNPSSHMFTTTAPVVQRALWLYSTSRPPPLDLRMRGCAPSSSLSARGFHGIVLKFSPLTKALLRGY